VHAQLLELYSCCTAHQRAWVQGEAVRGAGGCGPVLRLLKTRCE
jgi:hypothetical protein